MQSKILEQNPTANLRVYAVWVPFLGGTQEAADLSERVLPDQRVDQYWDGGALTSDCEPPQSEQLVHGDMCVLDDAGIGGGALDEFGVAQGDGDRGAELVGSVLKEPPLLIKQARIDRTRA